MRKKKDRVFKISRTKLLELPDGEIEVLSSDEFILYPSQLYGRIDDDLVQFVLLQMSVTKGSFFMSITYGVGNGTSIRIHVWCGHHDIFGNLIVNK